MATATMLTLSASLTACAAPEPAQPVVSRENPGAMNAPAAMIDAAFDDAAQRTATPRGEIRVESAEPVTWPDGSLGCPQPGMMYTQALVPGYRIVLVAGQERLAYHAGRTGMVRFCPAGQAQQPLPDDRI